MGIDGPSVASKLGAALVETLSDPLRTQVYIAIFERPGATVGQLARRLEEPPRRVRYQVDRLIEMGMILRDTESRRRNAREQHYRGVVVPTLDEDGAPWTDGERLDMSLSLIRHIAADIGRAVRHRTLGTRSGHTEVRVPGEVDDRGWAQIGATMIETMERVERIMIASAERLAAAGEPGIEVIVAQLFFEAPAWEGSAEPRQGPRPSPWAARASAVGEATECGSQDPAPSGALRDALVDALADGPRSRIFITVAERPGATIAQIADRIGESPRRVRHQLERLVEDGLIVVEAETRRRNARERHYRVLALPAVLADSGPGWTDEQRRKISRSVVGMVMADLDAAIAGRTFANRPGYAVVRIPGEVDERGWTELATTLATTMAAIEASMFAAHARLEEDGRTGTEVIAALVLFEGAPWERGLEDRDGPRPTHWVRAGSQASSDPRPVDPSRPEPLSRP